MPVPTVGSNFSFSGMPTMPTWLSSTPVQLAKQNPLAAELGVPQHVHCSCPAQGSLTSRIRQFRLLEYAYVYARLRQAWGSAEDLQ